MNKKVSSFTTLHHEGDKILTYEDDLPKKKVEIAEEKDGVVVG
jgi:hypothetical protein